jgi:cell division cycle 20-like protein 1 (cofactor of APC complex)
VTGSKDGYVSIQDYRTNCEVFRYKAHEQEISGLRISPNNDMIATGGNDNRLLLFSLKTMDKMTCWNEHNAAVKAISFNPKHPSIASGGGTADKKIRIFSLNSF